MVFVADSYIQRDLIILLLRKKIDKRKQKLKPETPDDEQMETSELTDFDWEILLTNAVVLTYPLFKILADRTDTIRMMLCSIKE